MPYAWDYEWRECINCRVVYKLDPPDWCIYCGGLTIVAVQPPFPDDDLRHATDRGYKLGCRKECCVEAHRNDNARYQKAQNEKRAERLAVARLGRVA